MPLPVVCRDDIGPLVVCTVLELYVDTDDVTGMVVVCSVLVVSVDTDVAGTLVA